MKECERPADDGRDLRRGNPPPEMEIIGRNMATVSWFSMRHIAKLHEEGEWRGRPPHPQSVQALNYG